MTVELKMVVRIKSGGRSASRDACMSLDGWNNERAKSRGLSLEGLIHRVRTNIASVVMVRASNVVANPGDRNTSSPTNLQLTVHLNRNLLLKSKERDKYPILLACKNGNARMNYFGSPCVHVHLGIECAYLNLSHHSQCRDQPSRG